MLVVFISFFMGMKFKMKVFSLVYLPLCRTVLYRLSPSVVTVELPAAVSVGNRTPDAGWFPGELMEGLNIISINPAVMCHSSSHILSCCHLTRKTGHDIKYFLK